MENELDILLVDFGKHIEDAEFYGVADYKQKGQWSGVYCSDISW